jgi:hypothetical protein
LGRSCRAPDAFSVKICLLGTPARFVASSCKSSFWPSVAYIPVVSCADRPPANLILGASSQNSYEPTLRARIKRIR